MTAPTLTLASAPEQAPEDTAAPEQPQVELITQDLLVEDVSIDGMCGVY